MPEVRYHTVKVELEFPVDGTRPVGEVVDRIAAIVGGIGETLMPPPADTDEARAYTVATYIRPPRITSVLVTGQRGKV
jgi:hypothetical protein